MPAASVRRRCDGTNSWDGVKTMSGGARQVRASRPRRLAAGRQEASGAGGSARPEKRIPAAQPGIGPFSRKFAVSANRRNSLRHMSSMTAAYVVHCWT